MNQIDQLLHNRYTRVIDLPANIELRKVKHHRALSEETDAFTAEVWIDGRKYGTVENTGKGGCHSYHPHQLEAVLAARAQQLDFTEGFEGTSLDADCFLDRLLLRHDLGTELDRRMKKGWSFRRGRELYLSKMDPKAVAQLVAAGPKVHDEVQTKLRADVVYNFLPREQAIIAFAQLCADQLEGGAQ